MGTTTYFMKSSMILRNSLIVNLSVYVVKPIRIRRVENQDRYAAYVLVPRDVGQDTCATDTWRRRTSWAADVLSLSSLVSPHPYTPLPLGEEKG